MRIKNSIAALAIVLCSLMLSAFVFLGCSGGSNTTTSSDSSNVQTAPVDTSSMQDTTHLDTASTRPTKDPNK
jgi:hypothetical protein